MEMLVTVHRFRVRRPGLRTKKALKTLRPRLKGLFSHVIANLAPSFGLRLTKLTLFVVNMRPKCSPGTRIEL